MIKALFIGLIFYIGFSITFTEKKYNDPFNGKPYKNHKKEYKKILNTTQNSMSVFIEDLKAKDLHEEASTLVEILETEKSSVESYQKTKRSLKSSFSYFGYESKKIFWVKFGGALFSLLLTSFILLLICAPVLIKELKTFLITGALGFLYVSFFWVFHCLFIKSDYGNWAYNISYIVCAVVSTFLVLLLVLYFNHKEYEKQKIKEGLHKLVDNGNELLSLLKK